MEEKKHCKWYNEEFCTNDKSPCVADYCPVVEYPELCKVREEDSVEGKKIIRRGMTKKEVALQIKELRKVVENPYMGIQDKNASIADFMKIVEELLEAGL